MQSRWKNIGMYLSIISAVSTAGIAYLNSQTLEQKLTVITGLIIAIAGIISNPKEGIGYIDKK